jgi:tRNA (guanine37-N1)-methyltransferase
VLSPQGKRFDQAIAEHLVKQDRILMIAGHYEGFDERIIEGLRPMELSIGDYVLSGGELAAMVVVDAIVRLLPGALGAEDGAADETFTDGLIEHPQYARPREFRGMSVPDVLLSGNHKLIAEWRLEQRKRRTRARRPDLWDEFERRKNDI